MIDADFTRNFIFIDYIQMSGPQGQRFTSSISFIIEDSNGTGKFYKTPYRSVAWKRLSDCYSWNPKSFRS